MLIQAQALADSAKSASSNTLAVSGITAMSLTPAKQFTQQHMITKLKVTVSELKDSTGLVYVGAVINKVDLSLYLSQLAKLLGDDFAVYRQNQAIRDHNKFHVTLINPYEYQKIDQSKVTFGQEISVSLQGIGIAKEKNKTSYFVVVDSSQGQHYRQQLLLLHKDLHVTLGFDPQDVYSVRKDKGSLLKFN
jgi:hypothetical protein